MNLRDFFSKGRSWPSLKQCIFILDVIPIDLHC